MTDPRSMRSRLLAVIRFIGAAVAAALADMAWLGWHAPYKQAPGSTTETGPYEPWQVVGLALTWTLVVVVASWPRAGLPAVSGATAGLVGVWSADAATRASSYGLWPVGAMMLCGAAILGGAIVASLTSAPQPRRGS